MTYLFNILIAQLQEWEDYGLITRVVLRGSALNPNYLDRVEITVSAVMRNNAHSIAKRLTDYLMYEECSDQRVWAMKNNGDLPSGSFTDVKHSRHTFLSKHDSLYRKWVLVHLDSYKTADGIMGIAMRDLLEEAPYNSDSFNKLHK